MAAVAAVLASGLASIFVVSAVSKISAWEETLDWLDDLFPSMAAKRVAVAVVAGDIAVVGALAVIPMVGGLLALMFLLAASGVLVAAYAMTIGEVISGPTVFSRTAAHAW